MTSADPTRQAGTQPAQRWSVQRGDEGVVALRSSTCVSCEPGDWRARLTKLLRTVHGAAAVGAKRLDAAGRVASMGEFLLHPKGFHALGKGVVGQAYRFPEEVDVVTGGCVVMDERAFEGAGGEAALAGELGMVELCLRLRQGGGRVLIGPEAVAVDAYQPSPVAEEAGGFRERWGFDWRAADLDVVAARYAGTGLLWQARLWGQAMPFEKYEHRPAMHWQSYEQVEVYRQRADHLVRSAAEAAKASCLGGQPPRVLDLGCGDGLFTHLLASAGCGAVGVDTEASAIEQAKGAVAGKQYGGQRPGFEVASGSALPFEDGAFDAVVMLDVIEHLPNPVAVLREVSRVVKRGGALVVTTPCWQFGGWSDAVYHVTEYSMEELTGQVEAVTGMAVVDKGMIGGVYRDLVVVARREG